MCQQWAASWWSKCDRSITCKLSSASRSFVMWHLHNLRLSLALSLRLSVSWSLSLSLRVNYLMQCLRIRILRFFRLKKHGFLRFFEMTYQKVVKSHKKYQGCWMSIDILASYVVRSMIGYHSNSWASCLLRIDWTDSGIIRNLNSIGKLTLKVPEAGVI